MTSCRSRVRAQHPRVGLREAAPGQLTAPPSSRQGVGGARSSQALGAGAAAHPGALRTGARWPLACHGGLGRHCRQPCTGPAAQAAGGTRRRSDPAWPLPAAVPFGAPAVPGLPCQTSTFIAAPGSVLHGDAPCTHAGAAADSEQRGGQPGQRRLGASAQAAWARLRRLCWALHSQLGAAGRLHLGLFYCYGLYHSWAKRATGAARALRGTHAVHSLSYCDHCLLSSWSSPEARAADCMQRPGQRLALLAEDQIADAAAADPAAVRYLFIGQLFEQRPTYRLLGWLLFLQLGISAAAGAVKHGLSALGVAASRRQQLPAHLQQRGEQPAVVLHVRAWLCCSVRPIRHAERPLRPLLT